MLRSPWAAAAVAAAAAAVSTPILEAVNSLMAMPIDRGPVPRSAVEGPDGLVGVTDPRREGGGDESVEICRQAWLS